jgi:hypothetical protein
MKKYYVVATVKEYWEQSYLLDAKSSKEALKKVKEELLGNEEPYRNEFIESEITWARAIPVDKD